MLVRGKIVLSNEFQLKNGKGKLLKLSGNAHKSNLDHNFEAKKQPTIAGRIVLERMTWAQFYCELLQARGVG